MLLRNKKGMIHMTLYDVNYYYEHRLLPETFYADRGKFITTLASRGGNVLISGHNAVFEHFGAEFPYSPDMYDVVTMKYDEDTFLLKATLPEPEEPALCYFAYMMFNNSFSELMYFCLEKSEDIGLGKPHPLLCGWTDDGKHLNFGPCETDEEAVNKCVSVYLKTFRS